MTDSIVEAMAAEIMTEAESGLIALYHLSLTEHSKLCEEVPQSCGLCKANRYRDMARAALTVALDRMKEQFQEEIEYLYTREAESMSLAPNTFAAGYDGGKREGVQWARDQLRKEALDE